VILYRNTSALRLRRSSAPEAPFWCATTIAPYSGKRGAPVSIDYLGSRATAAGDRNEVTVCNDVRDELERTRIAPPVLIDATEAAELVFRRGEQALELFEDALYLTSTRSAIPAGDARIAIAAWPLEIARLRELFEQARGARWGVVIPVIYPITTDLDALGALCDLAREHRASFVAAMPIEVDATAKQAIAHELELTSSDDRYAMLFHSDVAPIHLATERHIAALAHERGLSDSVTHGDERTNWNAAALLTLTASRMIAMELDLDLAGLIARSARAVADLDKPIARVAEAASLSIVEVLDETSAKMLTEWLRGEEPGFARSVNEQWRLSRSSGAPPSPSC
jgi:hypothetical protein